MDNFLTCVISESNTLKDAMYAIDRSSLRIAVVCDETKKLLGVLTDGDIRRALLSGAKLKDGVRQSMNSNPIVSYDDDTKEKKIELLRQAELVSVPVVDKKNRLVEIETLNNLLKVTKIDTPIFIMAGGFGTRLKPMTDTCPKPMLLVGGKPMLERLIVNFKKQGFYKFYLSVHYLSNVITEYFGDGSAFDVQIEYIYENIPLGTGGALGLLPGIREKDLLIINGDVLTNIDFLKFISHHKKIKSGATICLKEYEYQIPYGVVQSDGEYFKNSIEKPVHQYFVNTGIYIINTSLIKNIDKNVRIDMPDLLSKISEDNEKVGVYKTFDYWLDIGEIEDYNKAQTDVFLI